MGRDILNSYKLFMLDFKLQGHEKISMQPAPENNRDLWRKQTNDSAVKGMRLSESKQVTVVSCAVIIDNWENFSLGKKISTNKEGRGLFWISKAYI